MNGENLVRASLSELHALYLSVMEEAGNKHKSPRFTATVAELKRRGIRSLTTLERRIAAEVQS